MGRDRTGQDRTGRDGTGRDRMRQGEPGGTFGTGQDGTWRGGVEEDGMEWGGAPYKNRCPEVLRLCWRRAKQDAADERLEHGLCCVPELMLIFEGCVRYGGENQPKRLPHTLPHTEQETEILDSLHVLLISRFPMYSHSV